ncbi:MAG: hypothetical protein AAF725_07010 [Acidobacteriota bacterium]
MRTLSLAFLVLIAALSAPSAFAWGLFGLGGADCDGDGAVDITCSGSACTAIDEGEIPNVGGYCDCERADGTHDIKRCADRPSLQPESASLFGQPDFGQQLAHEEAQGCRSPEPESSEAPALSAETA